MLRKLFKDKNPAEIREAAAKVAKLIKEKKLGPDKIHILDVAESCFGDEAMHRLRHSSGDELGVIVQEAVDPVNLTAFSNITGQLVLQGVYDSYQSPEYIGDQLVNAETSVEDNTRVPGLQPIDDDALVVKEGEEFPDVKYGEDYIDIPKSEKRGMKIGITREMIFFDKTGRVMEMARGVGERLGTNREKRILRVVLGIDNNFVRKGVARDTYVATGGGDPRVNQLAGTELIDWTDIDEALQLFAAMTDDRSTPEPIIVQPDTLLVTAYKIATANRILNATQVEVLTDSGNQRAFLANPIAKRGISMITSPWIQWLLVNEGGVNAANAKNYWHFGQPKKAFTYRTLFPLNVRAARHDKDEFERDVVAQFRADERGVCYTRAPWYMAQFYVA